MPLIRETIVVTENAAGVPNIASLGLIAEAAHWIVAPFHPSTTLDNLRARPFAVAALEVVETREDSERPRFHCRVVAREAHRAYGRAFAAVVEGAVLASRLDFLAPATIEAG